MAPSVSPSTTAALMADSTGSAILLAVIGRLLPWGHAGGLVAAETGQLRHEVAADQRDYDADDEPVRGERGGRRQVRGDEAMRVHGPGGDVGGQVLGHCGWFLPVR